MFVVGKMLVQNEASYASLAEQEDEETKKTKEATEAKEKRMKMSFQRRANQINCNCEGRRRGAHNSKDKSEANSCENFPIFLFDSFANLSKLFPFFSLTLCLYNDRGCVCVCVCVFVRLQAKG